MGTKDDDTYDNRTTNSKTGLVKRAWKLEIIKKHVLLTACPLAKFFFVWWLCAAKVLLQQQQHFLLPYPLAFSEALDFTQLFFLSGSWCVSKK